MKNWRELMGSHRYAEVVQNMRRQLASNPDDMTTIDRLANALRAAGEYREALPLFEQLDADQRADKVANILAPGTPGRLLDIGCLHWLLGDRAKAMQIMHGLAAGILDGSIQYGDLGGGMAQGFLLYYMAVTEKNATEMSFALDYLANRLKRKKSQLPGYYLEFLPTPLAAYYLGEVPFATVMEAVDPKVDLARPVDPANWEHSRRGRLCNALFHDGVKSRAQGDEAHCLARMRECYGLENPLNEQEWYLAKYEVERADSAARGKAINP